MDKKQTIFSQQENLHIPTSFFKEHRDKLSANLKQNLKEVKQNSIILLRGVPSIPQDDQDVDFVVEQEDIFYYLFGVEEADVYGVVELDTGKTILFPKKIPEEYKIWMIVLDAEDYLKKYQVEEVQYLSELENYLKHRNPSIIYIYDGENSDSGLRPRALDLKFLNNYNVNSDDLYEIINEQKTVKDQTEQLIMEFICKISSESHIRVMQQVKPGIIQNQMEGLFKFHCMDRCGAKHKSYDCICASGEHNATLHYITNDKELKDGELVLNDIGSKYKGYCSDITCVFPVNGKFTQKQKEIYEAVLEANFAVRNSAKAGIKWDDMHLLAEKVILEHLLKLGIINNFPIQELQDKRIGAIFFPHGLGHFLGGRVHDVGGYTKQSPPRRQEAGLRSLRTRRVLQEGNVITIEPGLYFMKLKLEKAFADPEIVKYLNIQKIEEYRDVGGVRIEDDVIITKDGIKLLSIVPRTVEEIELCMSGKDWEKQK